MDPFENAMKLMELLAGESHADGRLHVRLQVILGGACPRSVPELRLMYTGHLLRAVIVSVALQGAFTLGCTRERVTSASDLKALLFLAMNVYLLVNELACPCVLVHLFLHSAHIYVVSGCQVLF